jgi:hypothetical protein
LSSQILAARKAAREAANEPEEEIDDAEREALEQMEENGTRVVGFVRAEKTQTGPKPETTKTTEIQANPDEIAIDESEEESLDGEEKEEPINLEKQSLPAAIFGGLASQVDSVEQDESLGAKDRFKRKRAQD